MNAWTPRLAMGLAALAAFALLPSSAQAQQDGRKKQEIQLGELPSRSVADAPFQLIAKSTSGLTVTFEVIDGPAVVDGKKLRLTGSPGLVIVRATQAGNAAFAPAVPAERVFTVSGKPFPPSIDIQPFPASGAIGDQVVLSAVARGEPLPAFQWRRDGTAIPGATSPRLVIISLSVQDAGTYELVATNDQGSATSARVRVTVGKHSQLINFPSQGTVVAGQSIPLNATATSGLPIEYRLVSGSALLSGNTVSVQTGSVIVEADQRGDSNYEAAPPVLQTFNAMPGSSGAGFP